MCYQVNSYTAELWKNDLHVLQKKDQLKYSPPIAKIVGVVTEVMWPQSSAMGGCGHGGYVYVCVIIARHRTRANLVVKSNSRETHFRVVLVYKLLVTMSA